MKLAPNKFVPFTTQKYLVLSTSNQAAAKLGKNRLVFYRKSCDKYRMKINMDNGTVTTMTPDEIKDYPVGDNHQFFNHFKIAH